jgi:hypothetical protein
MRSIKTFQWLKIIKMALSGKSDATALFLTVGYTFCDTYIDFPQSCQFRKVNFLNMAA